MEKFASISDQIIAWANKSKKEKDGHMLIRVIQLVFKKAMDEATWSEMYVQCCTGRKMIEQISTNIQDNGIKNNGKPVLNVFSAICWSFYFYLRIQVHTLPCLVCQSYMFSQALFYPHSWLLWSWGVFHLQCADCFHSQNRHTVPSRSDSQNPRNLGMLAGIVVWLISASEMANADKCCGQHRPDFLLTQASDIAGVVADTGQYFF